MLFRCRVERAFFMLVNSGIITQNGQIITIDVRDMSSLLIQLTTFGSATIQFEFTIDGTNWYAMNSYPNGSTTAVTSATANGIWFANVSGVMEVRVRTSAYASGNIGVLLSATQNGDLAIPSSGGGGGSNSAASATGSAVPANAGYTGINVAGTLRGMTGVNPSGSIYAGQVDIASIAGTTAVTAGVNGLLAVGGNIASGSADSGNPVKIGGVYNSTLPTLTTGQRGDIQLEANGTQRVSLYGKNSTNADINIKSDVEGNLYFVPRSITNSGADAQNNNIQTMGDLSSNAIQFNNRNTVYNGSTWDRVRSVGIGDGAASTGIQATSSMLYNGTTFDRQRSGGVTGAAMVSGATASGSAVAANPVTVGSQAATSLPTAVSNAQVVNNMSDKFGRSVVIPQGTRDIVNPITKLILTASTTETTLISAVASTFNDLLSLIVINTSATATQVDFRDSTAGTIRASIYVPAGDTRGVVFQTPMPQAAVNTAWTAQCGTSVSSVIITGQYIANK